METRVLGVFSQFFGLLHQVCLTAGLKYHCILHRWAKTFKNCSLEDLGNKPEKVKASIASSKCNMQSHDFKVTFQ